MSKNKKQLARELKSPDKFQTEVIGMLDWFNNNKKPVLVIVVPLAIAVVGFFSWQQYDKTQTEARLVELGKISMVYDSEEEKASNEVKKIQDQVAALESQIGKNGDKTKKAKNPKEIADIGKQIVELKDKMDKIEPDHTTSLAEYQKLFKKYDNKPEGWAAGMTVTGQFLSAKKLKEAKSIIETIIAKSVSYPFYQIQGRLVLISINEELGDFDAALTEVDKLSKIVDKDLQPRVLLTKGRIQLLKKSNDDAIATFKQLIEKHGSSPEAQKARTMQSVFTKGG